MQYAISQGWDLFDIYSDDGYAGSDRNRPQFKRLLADAQAHKFDIILCQTQSRFTRELELVEKYIHGLFPIWGIRFVSIVDNADTDNKGNKKSRQINGLVNEWYLEDMSENIRSVLTSRRENGFHIGGTPYRYDSIEKIDSNRLRYLVWVRIIVDGKIVYRFDNGYENYKEFVKQLTLHNVEHDLFS